MKFIILLTLLPLSQLAFSQANDGIDERWYINPNIGVIIPDDDIQLNEAEIIDLRFGKVLGPKWGFEMGAFSDEYDFDINYDLSHEGVFINFLNINHEPLWKPYFLMGAGVIRHHSATESGTNAFFNIGIGGSWYFFGDNVRLRAEAVSRLDLNDTDLPGQDGFGDGVFTVGLTIPIGGR
jgi:hypothetical protein